MAKSNNPNPQNFKKYGVPFYSVAWVPYTSIRFDPKPQQENTDQHQDDPDQSQPAADEPAADRNYIILAGGGGEGRSGIRNAVLLSEFDASSYTLSDQPVAEHRTGSELPYRMAVHPGGDGLICAFPDSCRWFEWDKELSPEGRKLGVKPSDRVLASLQDVKQQLALAFNNEGSILASGDEDGNLKVFKWPSMEIVLNETKVHTSGVKDLDFSPDGKLLVCLGRTGCRVWDVISSTPVASPSKANDETFCGCRFSQTIDKNLVLYTAAVTGKGGSIITWNTTTWKRIGSKFIVRDMILSFDVSADGKLLACGTNSGDVYIVNSTSMRIQQVIKNAHLGFVTALRFSRDSRSLASSSLESSARVTIIEEEKKNGGSSSFLFVILIILIAIAAYFYKNPESLKAFTG